MDVVAKYIARETLDEQSTDHHHCLEIDLGLSVWIFPHFSADPSPSGLVASVASRNMIGNLAGPMIMNAEKLHGRNS